MNNEEEFISSRIIKSLINIRNNNISNYKSFYFLIEDKNGFLEEIEIPKKLNYFNRDFSIYKINYKNRLEIDKNNLFEDIIKNGFCIILFKYGRENLKNKFEDLNIDILDFSILKSILDLLDIEVDKKLESEINKYSQDFGKKEFFKNYYESIQYFLNNSQKFDIIANNKIDDFFTALILFFGNRFFFSNYYKKLIGKFRSDSNRRVLFETGKAYELIELIFNLKEDYDSQLISNCFKFIKETKNKEFQEVLNIVILIVKDKKNHQNFLKHIFLINLFQLKCGRGTFSLNQSDLDLFNRKSDYTLNEIFDTINQFCTFSDNYLELLYKPEFKDFLKKKYIKDFEKSYEKKDPNFKKKFLDSITKENLFIPQNEIFLFEKSYNRWIDVLFNVLFDDLINEIYKKIKINDFNFGNISKTIKDYQQNLSLMENFYYYENRDKTIINNLLDIMFYSIYIFESLNKNKNNTLEFWIKSKIINNIFNIERKYREIRKIFVMLDKKHPFYDVLNRKFHKKIPTLDFIEFVINFTLDKFFSVIKKNYSRELLNEHNKINFTKDVFRSLNTDDKKKNFIVIIIDCLRIDFWDLIWKDLLYKFNLKSIKKEKIYSLLPSISKISRESIYCNNFVSKILTENQIIECLEQFFNEDQINIIKYSGDKEIIVGDLQEKLKINKKLNLVISTFPDIRIHKIEKVKELYNENNYNQIKDEIKDHIESIFRSIFNEIKELGPKKDDYEIFVTSDHGFIDYYKKLDINNLRYQNLSDENLRKRYIKVNEKIHLNNEKIKNNIYYLEIFNDKKDSYYLTHGRYYFSKGKSKSKTMLGHGGISFYENIVPFYSFKPIKTTRSKYKPNLIWDSKDLYLSSENQLLFSLINEDQNYSLNIKSVKIYNSNNILIFNKEFSEEEGILPSLDTSQKYKFHYMSNNERFELKFEILYSFVNFEGNETDTELEAGSKKFDQIIVKNPEVQLEQNLDNDIIKGKTYNFTIRIRNPNPFKISNIDIYLEGSNNSKFRVYKNGEEIERVKFSILNANEEKFKNITIIFSEKSKFNFELKGNFSLPNLQRNRFKGRNLLSIDVFASEDDLNRQRSFHI